MSIVYDWYENPNAEGDPEERGLHPRPLLNGKVTMKQLYARVHARSSLTTGDVMNAIDCLTQICGEELREGREVDRKSTRLNSSHKTESRMPSSA